MASRLLRIGVGLCVLMILSVPVVAGEFTADVIHEIQGMGTTRGTIYVDGQLMRMDTESPQGNVINISRPDKNLTWMIMEGQGIFMEMPYDPESGIDQWTEEDEVQATYVGDEKVSGVMCKKYKSVVNGETVYSWVSEELGFPVKVQSPEATMILKNIKKGDVPASTFEVPPGYQEMKMPGGMMGGMPGSMMQ